MSTHRFRRQFGPPRFVSFAATLLWVAAMAHAGGVVNVEKIALRGDPAPGVDPPAVFTFADEGGVTEDGNVVFRGRADNAYGLWRGTPGNLSLVAIDGQQAPGTVPGVTFGDNPQNFLDNASASGGQTAWRSRLQGPGVSTANDWGIWTSGPGGSFLLAREGSPAAGLPAGINYSRVDFGFYRIMSDGGRTLFGAQLTGTGVTTSNDFVMQVGDPNGTVSTLVREGDPAPTTGMTFFGFGSDRLMNDAGVAAFSASLSSSTTSSVWRGTPGNLNPVVIDGDAAPGTGGLVFDNVSLSNINNNGAVLFYSPLQDLGTGTVTRSLWRDSSVRSLEIVAKQGDVAPGTEVDTVFFAMGASVLNNSDDVVFTANMQGPSIIAGTSTGMWANTAGNTELIVRAGDQIPGQPDGVTFGQNIFDTRPLFNDSGLVVFQNSYTDGQGIFAWDEDDGLRALLARGDTIEVEPGDFRTIGGIGFRDIEGGVGSSDGQWSALNDRNELSVIINFLDGSGGTFLITIPEPASLAYLIVTTSFIAMRRRRRFETDN